MNASPETKPSYFSDEERAEIKALFREALGEFFKETGIMSKSFIVTAATIIGSIVVIFGGLKALLAWLGFTYTQ
ncbi:hypothetical protein [Rhodopseudomonas palustris]|uniref:hypothetical protein n=1 Tax=Rhodopseudomonas palustris TaxID=1076 RepID=UPI000D1A3003|nr:hypothetical protein [Rhodopseudomonas palustris]AVT83658.1 hypothetical protein RPYSC3_47980 [Rhodopseudomonas palustris]